MHIAENEAFEQRVEQVRLHEKQIFACGIGAVRGVQAGQNVVGVHGAGKGRGDLLQAGRRAGDGGLGEAWGARMRRAGWRVLMCHGS